MKMEQQFQKIKQWLDTKMQVQRANILKVIQDQQLKLYDKQEMIKSYTDIYNYVLDGEEQGQKMYNLFKDYNEIFLKQSEEIARKSDNVKTNFIEEILTQHQIYQIHSRIQYCYFKYLDRSFVDIKSNKDQFPNLQKQATKQFYDLFYLKLFSQIKDEFKAKLKQDRIQIDKEIQLQLQRIYKIIYDMKQIQMNDDMRDRIQNEIIEESKIHYQQQYNNFKQLSILDQIKSLVKFKEEELNRIKFIFGCEQNDLQKDLIELFNKYIIINYAQELNQDQNDTLKSIIFQDCFKEFGQLVRFFDHFKSNNHVFVKKFSDIIVQQGIEYIKTIQYEIAQFRNKQEKDEQYNKFLAQLIYIQQNYKVLIKQYAENNQYLLASLRQAFEQITANADQFIIMESLLLRLHTFSSKNIDLEEEKQLSQVMQLLECFSAKDLFLKNFQYKLASRMFTLPEYRPDIDKSIIDQFRKTFGPEHTKYLECMIKDYEQSINQDNIVISEIEIQAKILQKEFWPEIKPILVLDKILILNQLKSAYRQKFNSKQEKNQLVDIVWQDQISMMELQFKTNQEYKVTISVVGGAILLQYNDENIPLTYEQLSQQLNINNQYLINQIRMLKKRGLLIQDGQSYKFNDDFQNPYNKFKLSFFLEQYVEYQQEDIQRDRKIAIQAAIVRIMKAKRSQTYQQLTLLVKDQLKMFKPKDVDIKDVIEFLMNQDYLKRNPQNINELIYVS